MPILSQYSLVCQIADTQPYTIRPYNGTDLSRVIGIAQADLAPDYYGWVQEFGEALVRVGGQPQPSYVDFRPNAARQELKQVQLKTSQKQVAELLSSALDESPRSRLERLSQLPSLLIEVGPYCSLINEARAVFVDGHFYACVAMCGISLERFLRDKANPYGAKREDKMWKIRKIVDKHLSPGTPALCDDMMELRDDYAHGHGLNPQADALKALGWMHSFIDGETDLMRNYVIVEGVLNRTE